MEVNLSNGRTYLRSQLSMTLFERILNDQGLPVNFDLSVYGVVKPHSVRLIEKRFGRWLRYHQPSMFEEQYRVWARGREQVLREASDGS